jgi:hypothetical protein
MRATKGGLTHSEIMKLTWRQFGVYLDACVWSIREESEEGRKQNAEDDAFAKKNNPEWKRRQKEDTKRMKKELEKYKPIDPQAGQVKNMLN